MNMNTFWSKALSSIYGHKYQGSCDAVNCSQIVMKNIAKINHPTFCSVHTKYSKMASKIDMAINTSMNNNNYESIKLLIKNITNELSIENKSTHIDEESRIKINLALGSTHGCYCSKSNAKREYISSIGLYSLLVNNKT